MPTPVNGVERPGHTIVLVFRSRFPFSKPFRPSPATPADNLNRVSLIDRSVRGSSAGCYHGRQTQSADPLSLSFAFLPRERSVVKLPDGEELPVVRFS